MGHYSLIIIPHLDPHLWVQNTIFNDKSAILFDSGDSPGLAEIKTYAQKMQDAQVIKSLITSTELLLYASQYLKSADLCPE